MESETSKAEPKAVPLADFAANIDRRRAETGVTELPRNSSTAAQLASGPCSRRSRTRAESGELVHWQHSPAVIQDTRY